MLNTKNFAHNCHENPARLNKGFTGAIALHNINYEASTTARSQETAFSSSSMNAAQADGRCGDFLSDQ